MNFEDILDRSLAQKTLSDLTHEPTRGRIYVTAVRTILKVNKMHPRPEIVSTIREVWNLFRIPRNEDWNSKIYDYLMILWYEMNERPSRMYF